MTSQAPSANFVQTTITVTTPGRRRADAVDERLRRASAASATRSQYRTIPACESVNAVKTPIT